MIETLARLPEKTILDEKRLATILERHPRTIQRMIHRGELPPPVDFGNHKVWLVSHILAFIQKALEVAEREAEKQAARFARFSP